MAILESIERDKQQQRPLSATPTVREFEDESGGAHIDSSSNTNAAAVVGNCGDLAASDAVLRLLAIQNLHIYLVLGFCSNGRC